MDDSTVDAFLGFLAADIERRPENLQLLSAGSIARAVDLTRGITVGDDEVFPDELSV
jgi:hypothetical protein